MNDIVEKIEQWSKFLADLFKEPEIIDALAAIEKRKPGTLAKFKGDKLVDEHPKKVIAHLVNAGEQRNTGIPSEVAKKLINNIPFKDKLNINNTSEESNITIVPPVEAPVEPVSLADTPADTPVEVVPPESPQVEEVDKPEIQPLPVDVISTGETAPIQEIQEGQPLPGADENAPEQEIQESQSLPGDDVTNEQNVNNQSVENTINNDVSSLSDVDVATTAVDMANQSLGESEVPSVGSKGEEKTFVKSGNEVATRV